MRNRHSISLLFLIAFILIAATGCRLTDSVHRYDYTNVKYLAFEKGRLIQFSEIGVGRMTVYGPRMVREAKPASGSPTGDIEDVLPVITPGRRPTDEELGVLFDRSPDYRVPEMLISFGEFANRELTDNRKCYILGTHPLIVGFDAGTDIAADERAWLAKHPPSTRPTSRPTKGSDASYFNNRWAALVDDGNLQDRIGGIAIYPADFTESRGWNYTHDPGWVTLVQFDTPQRISDVFAANCDPDQLAGVTTCRMVVPARLAR